MGERTCTLPGCGRPHLALGLCRIHYNREWYKAHRSRPRLPIPAAERLWARTDRTGDCWVWLGGRDWKGYGRIRVGGPTVGTHRLSWEIHHGPIPRGLWVLHHCDNPPCLRPDHLFLGTQADNTADMVSKGRQRGAVGTANRHARLTPQQVADIRRRYVRGSSTSGTTALAVEYGVSDVMIGKIVRGTAWGEFDHAG